MLLTRKIPGEGKNAQKSKEVLAKEKSKEFQKNTLTTHTPLIKGGGVSPP